MITPPFGTTCYYLAVFEAPGAKLLVGMIAPNSSKDIERAVITSTNLTDVEATVELQNLINAVSLRTNPNEELSTIVKFNSLYLPRHGEMDGIEFDSDGDISTISGFTNPYDAVHIKMNAGEDLLADGKVRFSQFELPPARELLAPKNTLLS